MNYFLYIPNPSLSKIQQIKQKLLPRNIQEVLPTNNKVFIYRASNIALFTITNVVS